MAQPEIVTQNLATEIALGRVASPFSEPPFPNFQVFPIGLVPKKHSDKFRTIFHLSFPNSGNTSINHFISKEDHSLQYITIDNATEGILRLGEGCFLAKTDIESAFRLIPLKPSDYELFGMFWNNQYYYDKVLAFGLRSAPSVFNQLSDAVGWILVNKCGISFVCHILDDCLIIEPATLFPPHSRACQQNLSRMHLTFNSLGIPLAPHKTQGPCRTLEFICIILDTVRMEARLPPDKVERIQASLVSFRGKKSCTLKELQSFIGNPELCMQGRTYGQAFFALRLEWGKFLLVNLMGCLRFPAVTHRCLRLPWLWWNFWLQVVSGLLANQPTARTAWH